MAGGGVEVTMQVVANRLSGQYQKQLRAEAQAAVRKHLEGIRDDWSRDVRVDTGELRDSIAVEIESNGLEGAVGTDVEHAEVNEYGSATMPARPSARQAAEKHRPAFEAAIRRVTKALEQ